MTPRRRATRLRGASGRRVTFAARAPHPPRAARLTLLATAVLLSCPWGVALAQGVRITGATWLQSIDLRPLREDSVAASRAQGTGSVRRAPDGQPVQCLEGAAYCHFATNGARRITNPLLQDLGISAWGLGEGVSAHAHVRLRASVGGAESLWPRLDDRFDALTAYVQWERERARGRVGRLWATNGLGAYNYDGASVLLRRGAHALEAYGGRALVQGLSAPYTSSAIGAVDDLPPEEEGVLLGARLLLRPTDVTAITAVFQRVLYADRSSLVSDRVALDATTRLAGTTLDASLAYDVAGTVLNEARIRLGRRLPFGTSGAVEGRRHRPFFELWTIWGAFSPIGFDEGRAELSWQGAGARVQLAAHGGYRRYAADANGLASLPLRGNGWRAGGDATWLASERLTASAGYAVDLGFGAARTDVYGGTRWTPSERFHLGASLTGFQSIYEFRVGTGRVLGASLDAGYRLRPDLRASIDAGVYRHRLINDAPGTDWSQRRGSLRLEWAVGGDPGRVGSVRR